MTPEEHIRQVCKYAPEDELMLSDDITVDEALQAMKSYAEQERKAAWEAAREEVMDNYDIELVYKYQSIEDWRKEVEK